MSNQQVLNSCLLWGGGLRLPYSLLVDLVQSSEKESEDYKLESKIYSKRPVGIKVFFTSRLGKSGLNVGPGRAAEVSGLAAPKEAETNPGEQGAPLPRPGVHGVAHPISHSVPQIGHRVACIELTDSGH